MGVCRKSVGLGWVVETAKTKKQDDTMAGFKVDIIYTSTHNEPIIYYKT